MVGLIVSFGIVWLLTAVGAAGITRSKGRGLLLGLLLGVLLPIIGLTVVFAIPSTRDVMVPEGLKPVICPRCNAEQNAPRAASRVECWQCKQMLNAAQTGWGEYAVRASSRPAAPRVLPPEPESESPLETGYEVEVVAPQSPLHGRTGILKAYREDGMAMVLFPGRIVNLPFAPDYLARVIREG
jgi:hypothetical protein